jgi:hypothetical protein
VAGDSASAIKYKRNGTANMLTQFAPSEGWRHLEVISRSLRQPHIVELEEKNADWLIIAPLKQDFRIFGMKRREFGRAPNEVGIQPVTAFGRSHTCVAERRLTWPHRSCAGGGSELAVLGATTSIGQNASYHRKVAPVQLGSSSAIPMAIRAVGLARVNVSRHLTIASLRWPRCCTVVRRPTMYEHSNA